MPKLSKFKKIDKNPNYKQISYASLIVVGLLSIFIFSQSYAIYKMEKEYDVIRSKIGEFSNGDLRIAVYIDGEEAKEFPSYETNYKVEKIECTNGVKAEWDARNWRITIDDMNATNTKCTIYFNSKETNEEIPIPRSKEELLAQNEELTNATYEMLKTKLLNDTYPIGSIYMSTEDDTVEKVQEKFGGTWVAYSKGTTLVGNDGENYITNDSAKGSGGSSTATLVESNLPIHNHAIPALSVSTWSGSHSHSGLTMDGLRVTFTNGSSSGFSISYNNNNTAHPRNIITSSATVTVSGQTTTASNTNGCTNCSSTPFSVQDPYTVVYMYKRKA